MLKLNSSHIRTVDGKRVYELLHVTENLHSENLVMVKLN